MLIGGAFLMAGAGLTFAVTKNFWVLTIAGTLGVISPSGHEVGPFLSIEQAALSHVLPNRLRTSAFAWYTLAGSFATAIGSLPGGLLPGIRGYLAVVCLYAALRLLPPLLFHLFS